MRLKDLVKVIATDTNIVINVTKEDKIIFEDIAYFFEDSGNYLDYGNFQVYNINLIEGESGEPIMFIHIRESLEEYEVFEK